MSDIEFIDGLRVYAPHERAPDFVKANLVINVEELGKYLRDAYKAGEKEIRVDVKQSKGGKYYAAKNTYDPDRTQRRNDPQPGEDDFDDDIPF